MIKTIFLDLDDTILDFHRAEAQAIRKTLATLLGEELTEEVVQLYSAINNAQWKRLEKGELTIEEVKLVRFALLFEQLGKGISPSMAKNIYEKNLSAGHFFIDGAPMLLQRLHKQYNLYLASNGDVNVQNSRIASSGISRFFKGIFISQLMGAPKPQPAFFDACFRSIEGFDPKSAIILGDSLTSDILGGINAGILTCWFNPHGKPCTGPVEPHYQISSLDEFPALLARL